MALQNYINKMKSHKQDMNTKLSYWETEKQKGSKGEIITRNFLRKHGLDFKEQKSFNDLYYKSKESPLRFDFQIWFKDKWFLLEIQGQQHYKPSSFGGHLTEQEVQQNFEEGQERDRMKKDYCSKHNIVLKCVDWNGNPKTLIKDLQEMFRSL
jgi:hypothetical protein